jgi:hypothetical protein
MRTALGFIVVVIEKLQHNRFSLICTYDYMVRHIPAFIRQFEQIISKLIGHIAAFLNKFKIFIYYNIRRSE